MSDRVSAVGIASRYGLDGPGLELRRDEIFRTRPDRPLCPRSLLYNGYRVSFTGVKRLGCGVNHPPHLAPRSTKEWSYNSTPLRDFIAVTFYGKDTLNIKVKVQIFLYRPREAPRAPGG